MQRKQCKAIKQTKQVNNAKQLAKHNLNLLARKLVKLGVT